MAFRQTPGEQDLATVQGYLNGQPDILTAIIKHRMKIPGHLGDIYIQQFDPQGNFVTLQSRPPPARSASNEVKIDLPFNPPLKNIYDVRPRMHMYQTAALNHFKVPLKPVINYYAAPSLFPYTLPAVLGLCVLFFALLGQGHYGDLFRAKIAEFGGKYLLQAASYVALGLHGFVEPAYMFYATGQHKVPTGPRVKWILTTMLVGYGAINEFFECVQYERLRHIYKQTDVGDIGPRIAEEKPKTE